MAHPSDVPLAEAPEVLKCPICQWHDRKLRRVGSAVTPEERIAIHMWARHDKPLPPSLDPRK